MREEGESEVVLFWGPRLRLGCCRQMDWGDLMLSKEKKMTRRCFVFHKRLLRKRSGDENDASIAKPEGALGFAYKYV